MPSDLSIRQMHVSERDDVLAFLRTQFPADPRQSDAEFWDWHFPHAPYADKKSLPIWIARSGEKIVGQLAATPIEVTIDGTPHPAIWILDLIVDADHRRRGLARRLAEASAAFSDIVLGTNTPAQHSTELLTGMGWHVVSKIPRFRLVLFPGSALAANSNFPLVGPLADALYGPLRPSYKRTESASRNVEVLDAFDARFDDLYGRAKRQWRCSITRSEQTLAWQFKDQPGKRFKIIACIKNGELKGYAVLFFRKAGAGGRVAKAAISDICYDADDREATVSALMAASVKAAIEQRAGTLVTDVLDPYLEECLLKAGFHRTSSSLQLLARVPAELQAAVYDGSNWFLTRGDSDISVFERPNL